LADSNKTEKATPRREKKAREQGQIARSRDLISGVAFTAAVMSVGWSAGRLPSLWHSFFARVLAQACAGNIASAPLLSWSAALLVGVTGPVLAMTWIAAAGGALAQGGLIFAPGVLAPQISRLHPGKRLQQLFSLTALSRFLRAVLPACAVAYLAGATLARGWGDVAGALRLSSGGVAGLILGRAFEIAWKAALVLLAWAIADFFLERRHLAGELRMTRQELKDDYKETEGNPLIKGRIRRLRRQTLRRRMLEDAKRASVVITNPNEFAIALEYKPAMAAPMVIAKGRNLLAQQIKQVARWHGIPMIENPPLAHALYRATEIGQYIPPKLYRAVAAILAAIRRAEQRAQAGPGVNRG
jgi:flagellar biosynthesis protein FlhB